MLIGGEETEGALSLALGILKSGLYSPHYEVAEWTSRLLTKLATDFNDNGMIGEAWEWFIEPEEGGLQAVLYAMRKHHELTEALVGVLNQYGKYNFMELFTHHLKIALVEKSKYFDVLNDVFYAINDAP